MNSQTTAGIGWRQISNPGKPPIVLLRGLGRWSDHWCGFEDALAQHAEVTMIDHRGFGMSRSARVPWSLTIENLADDAFTVIEHLYANPVYLVGVSLGGMVASALAAKYPHTIAKLILVNSSVAGSPYPRLTKAAALTIIRGFFGRDLSFYRGLAKVLLGPTSLKSEQEELATRWYAIDTQTPVSHKNFIIQLLAARAFDAERIIKEISQPTLVVKSEQDQFVDSRNSDWIAKMIALSKSMSHPSGGHELGFDQRGWLIQQILDFVNTT